MHNLLTFGDLSEFVRKLINNKTVIRVYDDSGYAEEITIVGMITIKDYPDVLVQYVIVEDEDVNDALKKYVSCRFISSLFANGIDIFEDDQCCESTDDIGEGQYCFDLSDRNEEDEEDEDESDLEKDCDNKDKAKTKITKEEVQEFENALNELMEAIFNPANYISKKNRKTEK